MNNLETVLHVSEFPSFGDANIFAAYTATTPPVGEVVAISGNAVVIEQKGGTVAVVSLPRIEGDIRDFVPCSGAPVADLSWAF